MRGRGSRNQKKSSSRTKTILKARCMFDCSSNVDPNSIMNCYVPKSLKVVNSSKVNHVTNNVQDSNSCHQKEMHGTKNNDHHVDDKVQDDETLLVLGWKMGRSYSMGVGKIGRIDEEHPCDFKEVDVKRYFYPRCRSFAFAKQNLVH